MVVAPRQMSKCFDKPGKQTHILAPRQTHHVARQPMTEASNFPETLARIARNKGAHFLSMISRSTQSLMERNQVLLDHKGSAYCRIPSLFLTNKMSSKMLNSINCGGFVRSYLGIMTLSVMTSLYFL